MDFVVDVEVMTVREVRGDPMECYALDTNWLLTVENDGVINGVKGGREGEEEDDIEPE